VIVDYLYFEGIDLSPYETGALPVVDADTVLPFPLTFELLETVSRRNPEVLNRSRAVQEQKLPARRSLNGAKMWNVPVVK
jgi:hypothetical protein